MSGDFLFDRLQYAARQYLELRDEVHHLARRVQARSWFAWRQRVWEHDLAEAQVRCAILRREFEKQVRIFAAEVPDGR